MFKTHQRSIIALAVASIVITLFVAAPSARLQSITPDDNLPRFGLVGFALGQVARINAVKGIEPVPFRVALGFVDEDGIPLHDRAGNEIKREVELMPGHGAWLDVDAAEVLSRGELRKQIRAVVSVLPVAGVPPDPITPTVVATLEIFNRLSGRTEVLYASPANAVSGVDPTPF
jgi:hypothetical protein